MSKNHPSPLQLKRRKFGAIACIAAFASVSAAFYALPGPASASTSPVKLTITTEWNSLSVPELPTIIKQFEALHPNVTVSLNYLTGGAAGIAQLHTEFLSRTAPDIVGVFKKDFNSFQQAGYLTNLTAWAKSQGIYYNYYLPAAQSYASPLSQATNPHPQIYGIDDNMYLSVLFYNKGDFAKYGLQPPSNVAQAEQEAKVFNAHGIMPMCIDAGDTDNNDIDILAKAEAQLVGVGGVLAIDNGTAKYTDPPMMAAAKAVQDLVTTGVIGKAAAGANEAGCQSLVASGKAAMESMHTAILPAFFALEKEDPSFHLGVITNFNFTSHPVSEYAVTYGQTWTIPNSDSPSVLPVAEAFLKYMTSPIPSALEVNATGAISDTIGADKLLTGTLQKTIINRVLPGLTPQGLYMIDFIPTQVQDVMGPGIQELVLGKITYQTLMQECQAAQNQVMAQSKS